MPPMRVALVTNFSPHYRKPLFLEMSRRMDLTLLLTSRGTEWYELGSRSTDTGGVPSVVATSGAAVYRELGRGAYDAIVVGLVGRATLLTAFATARVKHLPLVLWVEIWKHPGTLAHRVSRPLARLLYRSADEIVAFGPHVAEYISRESGRTDGIFVAAQGADSGPFRAPVTTQQVAMLRERLRLDDRPTVVFVGRLVEEKGVSYLLQASARVDPPHSLVIAGRGPCLASLQQQAKSLGIHDRVRFVGHLDQATLAELLHASDLLVLPSFATKRSHETWGMVVNEAMSCGLPVVATNAVGAAAGGLVLNNETGLVVPQRDAGALATALEDLLVNESKRRQLGQAASKYVLNWNHASAADTFVSALHAARVKRSQPARPVHP